MKKVFILCLAIIIAVSSFPIVTFGADKWYDEAISFVTMRDYMKGYEDGDFYPDKNITRAELATVMNRVTGANQMADVNFLDVKGDDWHFRMLGFAIGAGFFSGYGDSTFMPDADITRQEAAVVLDRAFPGEISGTNTFSDSEQIAPWAREAVFALSKKGYINGYEDNTFRPEDKITRAEIASILSKILVNDRFPGTIANETIEGNLVVKGLVNLENVTVNGDIYITVAATDGECRFKDVKAENIIFCGKSNASILLDNSECKNLICGGNGEKIAILTGNTKTDGMIIRGKTKFSSMLYSGTEINADVYNDFDITGKIEKLNVLKPSEITVNADSMVSNLLVGENAADTIVKGEGNVKNVEAKTDVKVGNTMLSAGSSLKDVSMASGSKTQTSYSGPSGSSSSGGGGGSSGGGGGSSGGGGGSSGGNTNVSKPDTYTPITSIKIIDTDYNSVIYKFDAGETSVKANIGCIDSVKIKIEYLNGYDILYNLRPIKSCEEIIVNGLNQGENKILLTAYYGSAKLTEYVITLVTLSDSISSGAISDFNQKIQSMTLTKEDFENCAIAGVYEACVDEYNQNLKALGKSLSQEEIQDVVLKANSSTAKISNIYFKSSDYKNNIAFYGEKSGNTISVNVDSYINKLSIYPVPVSAEGKTSVNGYEVNENNPYTLNSLTEGVNSITVKSVSQNGENEEIYTVNIIKDKASKVLNKNVYLHDAVAEYTSSVSAYETFEEKISLDNALGGNLARITTNEFEIKSGETVNISIIAGAKGSKIKFGVLLENALNGAEIYLSGSENKMEYLFPESVSEKTYSYTATEDVKLKLTVKYNGNILIKQIKAEKEGE